MEDIQLMPGNHFQDCPGNGLHPGIECCCDECDFLICCYFGCDFQTCDSTTCPRKRLLGGPVA